MTSQKALHPTYPPGIHAGAGLQWDMSRPMVLGVDISIEHFPELGGEAYTAAVLGAGVQARAF